ncbi:hypothetical protein ACTFIV_003182 [Dictyostelium citrinum]
MNLRNLLKGSKATEVVADGHNTDDLIQQVKDRVARCEIVLTTGENIDPNIRTPEKMAELKPRHSTHHLGTRKALGHLSRKLHKAVTLPCTTTCLSDIEVALSVSLMNFEDIAGKIKDDTARVHLELSFMVVANLPIRVCVGDTIFCFAENEYNHEAVLKSIGDFNYALNGVETNSADGKISIVVDGVAFTTPKTQAEREKLYEAMKHAKTGIQYRTHQFGDFPVKGFCSAVPRPACDGWTGKDIEFIIKNDNSACIIDTSRGGPNRMEATYILMGHRVDVCVNVHAETNSHNGINHIFASISDAQAKEIEISNVRFVVTTELHAAG